MQSLRTAILPSDKTTSARIRGTIPWLCADGSLITGANQGWEAGWPLERKDGKATASTADLEAPPERVLRPAIASTAGPSVRGRVRPWSCQWCWSAAWGEGTASGRCGLGALATVWDVGSISRVSFSQRSTLVKMVAAILFRQNDRQ